MKKKSKIRLFFIPVLIIIGLLGVQAFCDLALPEYTAKIINNGIQSRGIDSTIPDVLTESMYNAILKISKEEVILNASYDFVVKNNLSKQDYKSMKKKYPIIKEENIYILKDIDEEARLILENKITKPFIIATMFNTNNKSIINMLNMKVADDINLLHWLMSIESDSFESIVKVVSNSLDALDDMTITQYGYISVESMYDKIGIDLKEYQINYIVDIGIKMLSIATIGVLVAIIAGYFISKLSATISYYLRSKVVHKIMAFGDNDINFIGTSSLITRSTNDIEQVKNFAVMFLRIVVFAPIIGIGAFVKVNDNPLNWLIAVAIILVIVLIGILFGLAMPKFRKVQKQIDKMNLVSREIINGMPVIRTFGTKKYEEERFDKANLSLTKTNLFVNRLMGLMMPSMMLVMNIITILIVWFGAKEISTGSLEVGTLLAFITYTMQIIMAFLMISMVSVVLPRALVSIKRIKGVLIMKSSIKEKANPEKFNELKKGIVEFKNVSFKYPDAEEAMLKNISFKATPGTVTAFIGSTGSGKSTLVNLIPRFFDVTEGEILVSGVNIKNVLLKDLRDRIGYVPQKGVLFSGTIESNLKLGNECLLDEEMKKAAQISQSLEFINDLEKGFKSNIAQGGANVSGGQKQRLNIARAIAKDPDIYIFDDSFSALDYKTDANLRKNLSEYAKDATVLIVAQRLSTIMNADNIIVLNEGEIVASGTHQELLKKCNIYKEIAFSQLKEDELHGKN